LTEDGWFDADFAFGGMQIVDVDIGGSQFDSAYALVIDPQGRIVLAGGSSVDAWTGTQWADSTDTSLMRLNDDGSLDTTFGEYWGGISFNLSALQGEDMAYGLAIDADGNIVMAGTTRLNYGHSDYDFYVAHVWSD
jgi:uncharacterized delta-60 repeat protein